MNFYNNSPLTMNHVSIEQPNIGKEASSLLKLKSASQDQKAQAVATEQFNQEIALNLRLIDRKQGRLRMAFVRNIDSTIQRESTPEENFQKLLFYYANMLESKMAEIHAFQGEEYPLEALTLMVEDLLAYQQKIQNSPFVVQKTVEVSINILKNTIMIQKIFQDKGSFDAADLSLEMIKKLPLRGNALNQAHAQEVLIIGGVCFHVVVCQIKRARNKTFSFTIINTGNGAKIVDGLTSNVVYTGLSLGENGALNKNFMELLFEHRKNCLSIESFLGFIDKALLNEEGSNKTTRYQYPPEKAPFSFIKAPLMWLSEKFQHVCRFHFEYQKSVKIFSQMFLENPENPWKSARSRRGGVVEFDPIKVKLNSCRELNKRLVQALRETRVIDPYSYVKLIQELVPNENYSRIGVLAVLQEVCALGDIEIVKDLLKFPAFQQELNAPNRNGYTCLQRACKSASVEFFEYLLDKGANPNVNNRHLERLFVLAIYYNRLDLVRLFHSYHWGQAIIYQVETSKVTPIEIAASYKNKEMIRLLLSLRAEIDGKNLQGKTALMIAAEKADLSVIELLVQNQANIHVVDGNGDSALTKAISIQSNPTVRLLLSLNATINSVSPPKIHPLIRAVKEGNTDVLETLMAHEAKIDCSDLEGNTPFKEAVKFGNSGTVCKILGILGILNRGSGINSVNSRGYTLLMEALSVDDSFILDRLLELNADIDGFNEGDNSVLMVAAMSKRKRFIELLLQRRANINHTFNKKGFSVLSCAVTRNHQEEVKLLLSHNPDLHYIDSTGFSALSHALFTPGCGSKIIEMLKEKDATNKAYDYAKISTSIKKMASALDISGEIILQRPGGGLPEKIIIEGCIISRTIVQLIVNELKVFSTLSEIIPPETLNLLLSIYNNAALSVRPILNGEKVSSDELFSIWKGTPLKKPGTIVFYSGFNKHVVGFIVSGNFFAICDRREDKTIQCYEMDPNKFSLEIIQDILAVQSKSQVDYENLLRTLAQQLGLKQTDFGATIEQFAVLPRQNSGSCVKSNSAGTLLLVLIILNIQKGYEKDSLPDLIKQQQVIYDSWNAMVQANYTKNYIQISTDSCYPPYLPLLEKALNQLKSIPRHIIEPVAQLVQQTIADINQLLPRIQIEEIPSPPVIELASEPASSPLKQTKKTPTCSVCCAVQ